MLTSKNGVWEKRYKGQNFTLVKSKAKFMYSYNDFECLFVRYKLEGIPAGVSIEKFCLSNKVPYNLFAKWYKDTRKKIIPVQVLGALSSEAENEENSFLNSGTKSRSGYSAFFEY